MTQPLLDEQQCQHLRRLTEPGFAQAAAMLARLLDLPVATDADLGTQGQPDVGLKTDISVSMSLSGDLQGTLTICFSNDSAVSLCRRLLRGAPITGLLAEPARSTLSEIGNILASACLASLDSRYGLRCLPSPPRLLRCRNGVPPSGPPGLRGSRLVQRIRLNWEEKAQPQRCALVSLHLADDSLQHLLAIGRVPAEPLSLSRKTC